MNFRGKVPSEGTTEPTSSKPATLGPALIQQELGDSSAAQQDLEFPAVLFHLMPFLNKARY